MDLQLHQLLASHRPLAAAFALSAILHGVLIWPAPALPPERPVRGGLAVAFAPQAVAPAVAQEPPPVLASRTATHAALAPRRGDAAVPAHRPDTAPMRQARAPAAGEGAQRALRYAIARHVTVVDVQLAGPVSLVLQVHVRARRVVHIDIARSSGNAEVDARVLAAFKGASREAVIPDAVPDHAFTTELELEVGG